ncbi:hypothetical protein GH733_004591 [Mirounga leonina]|nr:hypothetical protein GH733_004591 [Mirounga leonina]
MDQPFSSSQAYGGSKVPQKKVKLAAVEDDDEDDDDDDDDEDSDDEEAEEKAPVCGEDARNGHIGSFESTISNGSTVRTCTLATVTAATHLGISFKKGTAHWAREELTVFTTPRVATLT